MVNNIKSPKKLQELRKIVEKKIRERKKVEESQKTIYFNIFAAKEGEYALLIVDKIGRCNGWLITYSLSSSDEMKNIKDVKEITVLRKKSAINEAVEIELDKRSEIVINLNKKDDVNNILLIGRTGDGKSALANILSDTNEFKESEYGVSKTEEIQSKEFVHKRVVYRVIDTPGISHTKLSEQEVLAKIIGAVVQSIMYEKLNQVFFVTSNKFTNEELEAYNVLKNIIFDDKEGLDSSNIDNYITIIRTNFPNFMNAKRWGNDIKKIGMNHYDANGKIKCEEIVYMDNPPVDIDEVNTDDISNEQIAKIFAQDNGEDMKWRWKERKKERRCIHCNNLFSDKMYYSHDKSPDLRYCLECHKRVKLHVQEMNENMKRINEEIRGFSREKLLERLEKCQNDHYEANGDLEKLIKKISLSLAKIRVLEEERSGIDLPFNEKREILNKLATSICEDVSKYIERKNKTNNFLDITELDKNQIKEQLPKITTLILDESAKFINPIAPPAGLVISGVFGIVSGLIKTCWLKN